MDLLQTILNAGDGEAVAHIGQTLGLDPDQTMSAIQHMLPALAGGMAANAAAPGGLASLETALTSGGHADAFDDVSRLSQPDTIRDGNGILGHLLGSKDVSRQVAANASAATGIGADVLKKMLPMLATLAMGALATRATRSSAGHVQLGPSAAAGGGGLLDMLGPLLGGTGGASGGGMLGNVLGSLGGLFGKK